MSRKKAQHDEQPPTLEHEQMIELDEHYRNTGSMHHAYNRAFEMGVQAARGGAAPAVINGEATLVDDEPAPADAPPTAPQPAGPSDPWTIVEPSPAEPEPSPGQAKPAPSDETGDDVPPPTPAPAEATDGPHRRGPGRPPKRTH